MEGTLGSVGAVKAICRRDDDRSEANRMILTGKKPS
jgi:hypothetical protein